MTKKQRRSFLFKIVLFVIIVIFSIFLANLQVFHVFIESLHAFGYLGGFVGGLLFVNVFTAALGVVLLVTLSESHNIFLLSAIGGAGAVVGDLLIFSYLKYSFIDEAHLFLQHYGVLPKKFPSFLSTHYFQWTLPLIGALIIASPFPDEVGISLMGISRVSTAKFILLTYVLNTLGILAVVGFFDALFF